MTHTAAAPQHPGTPPGTPPVTQSGAGPADDRLEVTAVLFRLARAMDSRDWPLLRTCFTPDVGGVFATGPVQGIDAVEDQYQGFLTPLEVTQHLVTNTEVTLTGDSATASSSFHAQHVRTLDDGPGHFVIGGRYHDHLTRTSDGWRIAHGTVAAVWTEGDRRVVAGILQPPQDPVTAPPEP